MKTLPVIGYLPDGAPIYPIRGAEGREGGGYHAEADLVTSTLDNADLNEIWSEFQQTLQIQNEQRSAVTNLFTFRTVRSADETMQTIGEDTFEQASEHGEPVGVRQRPESLLTGYTFRDFDLATRFTWRFLRDVTQAQLEALHSQVLYSDNKMTTTAIMRRLLDPTEEINSDGRTCYGLWSGDDMAPPRYAFNTFESGHNHYLTSGSSTPDGADIDDLARHVTEHGYGAIPGSQLVLLCHPDDLAPLAAARTGDSAGSVFDFIPSAGAAAYLSDQEIIGPVAPAQYNRLEIAGSYGRVWIAPHPFMVPGYLALVASNGPGSSTNTLGFREHPNPAHQGLRLLPGNQSGYPLQDAFYARGFGVGVRHRGSAAVMQITNSSNYTPPSSYA